MYHLAILECSCAIAILEYSCREHRITIPFLSAVVGSIADITLPCLIAVVKRIADITLPLFGTGRRHRFESEIAGGAGSRAKNAMGKNVRMCITLTFFGYSSTHVTMKNAYM